MSPPVPQGVTSVTTSDIVEKGWKARLKVSSPCLKEPAPFECGVLGCGQGEDGPCSRGSACSLLRPRLGPGGFLVQSHADLEGAFQHCLLMIVWRMVHSVTTVSKQRSERVWSVEEWLCVNQQLMRSAGEPERSDSGRTGSHCSCENPTANPGTPHFSTASAFVQTLLFLLLLLNPLLWIPPFSCTARGCVWFSSLLCQVRTTDLVLFPVSEHSNRPVPPPCPLPDTPGHQDLCILS